MPLQTDIHCINAKLFRTCVIPNTHVERLWTGARWSEGPVWFAAARFLVWSDIPNNRMMRWDETNGNVGVFRQPSNNANGNTLDRQGRLVTCEHLTRRVTRTEHDGSITVLADSFEGKRLNSPNDVVVKSDGSIWFTDPPYGILSDYEGRRAESEIGACHLYRISPKGGIDIASDAYVKPNGLAFSPDEKILYVSDTGATHKEGGPKDIRWHRVGDNGRLSSTRKFATCKNGLFDGFRVDTEGRIWASAGDGVHCHTAEGELIGKILVPETVANVCFGGERLNRLFICGTTSLYSIYVNATGLSPV